MAKFSGCYWTIKDLDESGKTKDDIVLDAMNLYNQKCGKTFIFKHFWLLLKNYPHFAAIIMDKWKTARYDVPAPNQLLVDRNDVVPPNGDVLPTVSSPAQIRPQGAKSSKTDHLNMQVKKQALHANAKTTIEFADATMKKAEQIAQQNTFNLCTLEDKLITCDLARSAMAPPPPQDSRKPKLLPMSLLRLLLHHLEFVAPRSRRLLRVHQHRNSKG